MFSVTTSNAIWEANFGNLNLVDAYNHLVESNTKRKNNYFSPLRPTIQTQNNIYEKSYTFTGKNNSQYINQQMKTSDNSFLTKSDFIPGFNGNINSSKLSQPINYKRNNGDGNRGWLIKWRVLNLMILFS